MSTKDYYRKKIVDLRAYIAKERATLKRNNEIYASRIKAAPTPSSKASHRKAKIDMVERHRRQIERFKNQIEQAKASMKRCKK